MLRPGREKEPATQKAGKACQPEGRALGKSLALFNMERELTERDALSTSMDPQGASS